MVFDLMMICCHSLICWQGQVRLVLTDTANVSGDQGWHRSEPYLVVSGVHPNFAEMSTRSRCVATFDHDHAQYPGIMIKLPLQSEILSRILGREISNVEFKLYHHLKFIRPLFNFAYLFSLPPFV